MELECNRCKNKKIIGSPYIHPWFLCPLSKICLCNLCHSSFNKLKYDMEKKLLQDFIQPERLSPEDHIVDDNEMVSDSLNSTNK